MSDSVKKNRLNQLMSIQNEISLQINEAFINKTVQVMVEGPSRTDASVYTGRTSKE